MAEYYYNEGLTTGNNDGSTAADAWQTWSDVVTGLATLTEDTTLYMAITTQSTTVRSTTGIAFAGYTLTLEQTDTTEFINDTSNSNIFLLVLSGGGTVLMKNVRMRTYYVRGVNAQGNGSVVLNNCYILSEASTRGIYSVISSGSITLDHCVLAGHAYGIDIAVATTLNIKNSYIQGSTSAIYDSSGSSTINLTTTATSDATGSSGLQNIAYDTGTFVSVTAGSEDLNLASGSDLIDAGTVTDLLTDIVGDTYGATPNIGIYADGGTTTYAVTYDGNGSDGGTAPTDSSSPYNLGDTVTVLGNTGGLTRTGYTWAGWNTASDGSGTYYGEGDTFVISADTTLYAVWTINTHTVTYNGNGNDGGTAPTDASSPYDYDSEVTVLDNIGSLTLSGYLFSGWNTASDGSGTSYSAGDTFNITEDTVLYAVWSLPLSVTYDGNGNDGGSVPTDSNEYSSGDTVTVLGNTGSLTLSGYIFPCWNTASDGSGTYYGEGDTFVISADTTLYAIWMTEAELAEALGSTGEGVIMTSDNSFNAVYGVGLIISMKLKSPSTGQIVTPTLAAGDVLVTIDGDTPANITTLPSYNGNNLEVTLSDAEVTGKEIVIDIVDQTTTKEWLDTGFTVQTLGTSTSELTIPLGTDISSEEDLIDGFFDELLSGHTTAGSLGKAISDILEDTGTTIPALIAALRNFDPDNNELETGYTWKSLISCAVAILAGTTSSDKTIHYAPNGTTTRVTWDFTGSYRSGVTLNGVA